MSDVGNRTPQHVSFETGTLTISRARQKLAGWHFAQESLSVESREILHVAERLLRVLDDEADGWRVDR